MSVQLYAAAQVATVTLDIASMIMETLATIQSAVEVLDGVAAPSHAQIIA
ncbi:MAG: hypothetical protein HZC29_02975 [Thaumarchaeota archaeon]|nr:hypothetical protein [Nitrososphaerota archaeon]